MIYINHRLPFNELQKLIENKPIQKKNIMIKILSKILTYATIAIEVIKTIINATKGDSTKLLK